MLPAANVFCKALMNVIIMAIKKNHLTPYLVSMEVREHRYISDYHCQVVPEYMTYTANVCGCECMWVQRDFINHVETAVMMPTHAPREAPMTIIIKLDNTGSILF